MSIKCQVTYHNKNHNISNNTIENLPELLYDPQYIFKSSTQPGRYVGVLNDVDSQGRQILGILSPDGQVNFVPSAYGRNNFNKFLNDQINAGNLLYNKTGAQLIAPTIGTNRLAPASKGTGSAPTIGAGQPVPANSITDLPQNVNISPKQLYELTNNLSEMTTWGKPGTDLQNNILERLYGMYSGRLKKVSPEPLPPVSAITSYFELFSSKSGAYFS